MEVFLLVFGERFIGVVRRVISGRTDLVDHAAHELGAGENAGPHDDLIVRVAVQHHLDQGEVEGRATVPLDEVDNAFDALTNTIADDQQQELATAEEPGDVVDEGSLVDLRVGGPHQFVEHVAGSLVCPRYLALQVLVLLVRDLLGVVEDLTNDLPPRLRIARELELGERQAPLRVDVQRIH